MIYRLSTHPVYFISLASSMTTENTYKIITIVVILNGLFIIFLANNVLNEVKKVKGPPTMS
jgi:hypothetical protein